MKLRRKLGPHALAASLLLLALSTFVRAQSGDVNFPTPVFSTEVAGRIAPRDLGDPRRTRHFYTFRGTEGDVSVTLETSELIGDVDVFTATTLRPLVKFTLFGDATRATKSFYVRSEETLVLRVEARATGDSAGTYRLVFGGSFAPAPASLADAPEQKEPTLADSTRDRNARRVTSTGARVEEPKPEPTPAPAEEAAAANPQPTPAESAPARTTTRGRARSPRRPARARSNAPAPRPKPTPAEAADAQPSKDGGSGGDNAEAASAGPKAEAEKPAATPRAAPRRGNTRTPRGRASGSRASTDGRAAAAAPPSGAEPAPAAATGRLVIITLDGQLIERDMSTVRSVTVEKGELVVTTLDGKSIRRPMTNVLRMSIEP